MSSPHENLQQVWRDRPHLAFAFADFAHFESVAIAHRTQVVRGLYDIATAYVDDDGEAAKRAADRIRRARYSSHQLPAGQICERVGNRLVVWLYGPIGHGPAGCNADVIGSALEQHADVSAVLVRIASGGGNANHGDRIAYYLENHKARTVAIVDKFAFSAASQIAAACDRVLMRTDAVWMMHRVIGAAFGNAERIDQKVRELRCHDILSINAICRKRRIRHADARAAVYAGDFLSAIQAVDAGLADQIIPALPIDWGDEPEYRDE
jgi:ATP-dependent protease ClpP protease subunit